MKVVVVGDSCSGKSTALEILKSRGYPVSVEEGWQNIPLELEQDKLKGNIWFQLYFFDREKKISDQDMIIEHCLHYMYPFTEAQARVGKITVAEKEMAVKLLDVLTPQIYFPDDTVVIHLVCLSDLICSRLKDRGRLQSESQKKYRDVLRDLSARYLSSISSNYHKIDSTGRKPEVVVELMEEILSKYNFRKEK